jgi:hypothetical protein
MLSEVLKHPAYGLYINALITPQVEHSLVGLAETVALIMGKRTLS